MREERRARTGFPPSPVVRLLHGRSAIRHRLRSPIARANRNGHRAYIQRSVERECSLLPFLRFFFFFFFFERLGATIAHLLEIILVINTDVNIFRYCIFRYVCVKMHECGLYSLDSFVRGSHVLYSIK